MAVGKAAVFIEQLFFCADFTRIVAGVRSERSAEIEFVFVSAKEGYFAYGVQTGREKVDCVSYLSPMRYDLGETAKRAVKSFLKYA